MVAGDRIPRKHITNRAGIDVVEGWGSIAAILGRSERTVMRYRIPVNREAISGKVWIELSVLLRWAQKNDLL